MVSILLMFFFFQAEDGIRDIGVTGVQTCALPICAGEIDYTRTRLRIGDRDALVDQFNRPRDLHFVTVAFDGAAESREFQPLPWFGPEITAAARYSNQAIALRCLEQSQHTLLSDK